MAGRGVGDSPALGRPIRSCSLVGPLLWTLRQSLVRRSEKLQKERETIKPEKIIIVKPFNKGGTTFSSPSRIIDNIPSHIL